jgi:hypothetical protein
MTLKLISGDFVGLKLVYMESQQGWYYSLTYGNFILNNRRLVVGVNMLRAFRGLIPFGFACTTKDGYEPVFKTDFSSGRAKFFLLDSIDIQSVETVLNG